MVAQLLSFRWDIMPEAFLKIGSRYFLAAAIAFIIFYVVFKQQFFYKLIEVIHLLELASWIQVELAVAGEDVQLFEQLNGLTGAQVELRAGILKL